MQNPKLDDSLKPFLGVILATKALQVFHNLPTSSTPSVGRLHRFSVLRHPAAHHKPGSFLAFSYFVELWARLLCLETILVLTFCSVLPFSLLFLSFCCSIKFEEYKKCLDREEYQSECNNYILKSVNHEMHLQELKRSTPSIFDDKRCYIDKTEGEPWN